MAVKGADTSPFGRRRQAVLAVHSHRRGLL